MDPGNRSRLNCGRGRFLCRYTDQLAAAVSVTGNHAQKGAQSSVCSCKLHGLSPRHRPGRRVRLSPQPGHTARGRNDQIVSGPVSLWTGQAKRSNHYMNCSWPTRRPTKVLACHVYSRKLTDRPALQHHIGFKRKSIDQIRMFDGINIMLHYSFSSVPMHMLSRPRSRVMRPFDPYDISSKTHKKACAVEAKGIGEIENTQGNGYRH